MRRCQASTARWPSKPPADPRWDPYLVVAQMFTASSSSGVGLLRSASRPASRSDHPCAPRRPLLPPVWDGRDRPQFPLGDRIAACLYAGKPKDRLLDVRGHPVFLAGLARSGQCGRGGPTCKPHDRRKFAAVVKAPPLGLEPRTCRLTAGRSTIELQGPGRKLAPALGRADR